MDETMTGTGLTLGKPGYESRAREWRRGNQRARRIFTVLAASSTRMPGRRAAVHEGSSRMPC
jgi:hypothetical protein